MSPKFTMSATLVLLSGCAPVGPSYVVPEIALPQQFVNGESGTLEDASGIAWWNGLHDPVLTRLLTRGASQNLSIQAAMARMEEAEAGLRQVGLNAQIDGDLSASTVVSDDRGSFGANSNASFNARYIFDLFGGIRRGQENAAATFEAAQFDVGTVRLAYLADLTNAYLEARQLQQAMAITRQTIQSRRQTVSLVQQRRARSEATELEISQSRAQLRSAEADLPALLTRFEANAFAIATLLSETAQGILTELNSGSGQPLPKGGSLDGVPADLLRNRPDVRFAERTLAAATASIGIAEAELYPQLSLSGTVRVGDGDDWSFGPSIAYPVLNIPILRARRDAAIARAKQSEIAWHASVLSAVEEVQVALSRCKYFSQQVKTQRSAVAEARRALSLSRRLYELNEITLTDVLDAERNALFEQVALSQNIRDFSLAWVQLQVASGKGWQAMDLPTPEAILAAGINTKP